MNHVFITPAKGATVYDPQTNEPIPDDGAIVPETNYIRRRIADGDAIVGTLPTKPKNK